MDKWTGKSQPESAADFAVNPTSDLPAGRREWLLLSLWVGVPALVGLLIQLTTYINHDVAWVLWGSREMLNGAQYGRDIIEPNPPLAWYLSMPTTALAGWLGVQIDLTFKLALFALAVITSLSVAWLRPVRMSMSAGTLFAGLASIALITLSGREFGQREPIAIIFVLPYLMLAGRRFEGAHVPGPVATILIGLFAGLGFGLKPYFLMVPALIELLLLGSRRSKLFRPENLTAAAVILVYGVYVLLAEKTYLQSVIPMVREIYWSFDRSFLFILVGYAPLVVGTLVFAHHSYRQRCGLGLVLAAAFVGFSFSYLIQGKGYDYHLVPVRVTALLLAGVVVLDDRTPQLRRILSGALIGLYVVLWGSQLSLWWERARPGGKLHTQTDHINRSIATHARGSSFFVITVRTYPNFPAGIYAPAAYAAKANAQWFLPAVAQFRAKGIKSPTVEGHARDFINDSLSRKPKLILLDTNPKGHTVGPNNFDILGFYAEDPAFRAAWLHYHEIERIGSYRQFVRDAPEPTLQASTSGFQR